MRIPRARSGPVEHPIKESAHRRQRGFEIPLRQPGHVARHPSVPGSPAGRLRRRQLGRYLELAAPSLGGKRAPEVVCGDGLGVRDEGEIREIAVAGAGLGGAEGPFVVFVAIALMRDIAQYGTVYRPPGPASARGTGRRARRISKAFGCGIMVTRRNVETDAPIVTVPGGVLLAPLG